MTNLCPNTLASGQDFGLQAQAELMNDSLRRDRQELIQVVLSLCQSNSLACVFRAWSTRLVALSSTVSTSFASAWQMAAVFLRDIIR